MSVLVDSSVWIDFFRGGDQSVPLDSLIEENEVVINEVIKTELFPVLKLKNQIKLIGLLDTLEEIPMNIDWDQLRKVQYDCLASGINGIGLPDLIIAQNARQSDMAIYTLDHHFVKIQTVFDIELI